MSTIPIRIPMSSVIRKNRVDEGGFADGLDWGSPLEGSAIPDYISSILSRAAQIDHTVKRRGIPKLSAFR
jgi:hypothetical protein